MFIKTFSKVEFGDVMDLKNTHTCKESIICRRKSIIFAVLLLVQLLLLFKYVLYPSNFTGLVSSENYRHNMYKGNGDTEPLHGGLDNQNTITVQAHKPLYSGRVTYNSSECVPNIVHWIWFYPEGKDFKFINLISALSALYIQKPEKVFIWNSNLPAGQHWEFVLRVSGHIQIPIISKRMEPPSILSGVHIRITEHKTDITRLSALHDYGGIYMDLDVIVLKSLKPLMCKNEMILGAETEVKLNTGFMLAKPGARFIKLWLNYYLVNYEPHVWDFNAVCVPFNLWRLHTDLVHVELRSFHHPNWRSDEVKYIFNPRFHYDWSQNYVMHTWYRSYGRKHTPGDIKMLNTTLGQMFRFIWYGKQDLIFE